MIMTFQTVFRAALMLSLLTATACGFTPIYATPDGVSAPATREIEVTSVSAPEDLHVILVEALRGRLDADDDVTPKYGLSVVADESARPLAVQIDATVTRYNYRLSGRYRLRDLATGKVITGSASAITSYNIVSSQYSTLYAERTARQKASRLLSEKIEQQILLYLSEGDSDETNIPEQRDLEPDDISDIIRSDRDGTPEPFLIQEEEVTGDEQPADPAEEPIQIDERP